MHRGNSPDRLETWLRDVRKGLSGLPRPEIEETLQELRSHVIDRLDSNRGQIGLDAVLSGLGDPAEVARLNVEARMKTADSDRDSILVQLRAAARLGWRGTRLFLASAFGYGLALGCLVLTVAKIIAPDRFGLWRIPDSGGDLSISLGGYTPYSGAHDILGFWIIPLGLAVAVTLAWLTYRYDRRAVARLALGASQPGALP